ncbi:surface glycoprotein [Natrialba swarupiae]|uniref:CARDB domain-containing protein n=1 Tax=Natrialba swarupiae TaxID=2448032 RepID=A0A5D5AP96_9EURY|nr:surface glycoprotein [Natrialba swarupiae]TYT62843.1 hypothetical protein FYC77_05865 [Natrialba swarupiae]
MTRDDITYREKGRAAFLAAIMVLSVIAMSTAFVGSAVADAEDIDITVEDQVLSSDDEIVVDLGTDTTDDSATVVVTDNDDLVVAVEEGVPEDQESDIELTGDLQTDESSVTYNAYTLADSNSGTVSVGDENYDGTAGEVIDDANAEVYHTAYSIVEVEEPAPAYYGQVVDITATVENLGPYDNEETITLSDGVDYDVTATADGDGEVTFEDVDTAQIDGVVDDDNVNTAQLTITTDATEAGIDGANEGDVTFEVGLDVEGQITVQVQDREGDGIPDSSVELYTADGYGAGAEPVATATTGEGSNTHTFEGLAVGTSDDPSNYVNYVLRAENEERDFSSDTTQVSLHTPNQEGPTETLTLDSALDAQYIDVVQIDEDDGDYEVVGEDATLFANGEFDNNAEFAVVTQNQQDSGINGDLEVELEFTFLDGEEFPLTGDINSDFHEAAGEPPEAEAPGTFAGEDEEGDDEAVRSLTVTIDGDDVIDVEDLEGSDHIQNPDGDAPEGALSYATFDVTSEFANDTTLEEPIVTERFTATATNQSGDPLSTDDRDYNNVTYFLQGDQKITGEIVDMDGNELSGDDVDVWVAYDDADQSLDAAQQFQADGDAFLHDNPNDEDARFTITGLAGDDGDQDFNVYVKANGYNTEDLSDNPSTSLEELVADYRLDLTTNDRSTQGTSIGDVSFVLDQPPQDYDLDVTVDEQKYANVEASESATIEVNVTSASVGSDAEDFTPAQNQDVSAELIDHHPGHILEADEDGVATGNSGDDGIVEFTFVANDTETIESLGAGLSNTNVTAWTTNSDHDDYVTADDEGERNDLNNHSSQANVGVFTTAQLTGDVVDAEDNNIPGATVTLQVWDANNEEWLSLDESNLFDDYDDTRTTGPDGSYSYVDLPTEQEYRVTAEFDGEDGFATTNELTPGTTNADVVLTEVVIEEAFFAVEDLEPETATAAPGEDVTVSANVTNTGVELDSQTIDLRVDGVTVAQTEQPVELVDGEYEVVEFTMEAPDEEGEHEFSVHSDDDSATGTLTVSEDDGNDDPVVDEDVYNAVASLTGDADDGVTGNDLTVLRGHLIDGDNELEDGVTVTGNDFTLLRGELAN